MCMSKLIIIVIENTMKVVGVKVVQYGKQITQREQ